LALRNPLDTKQQDLATVKSNSLYKNISAPAPVVREKPKRKAVETPPPPSSYSVEVIRGNKTDVTKF
jgi:hypothetical protein